MFLLDLQTLTIPHVNVCLRVILLRFCKSIGIGIYRIYSLYLHNVKYLISFVIQTSICFRVHGNDGRKFPLSLTAA